MAARACRSLAEVQRRVSEVHHRADLEQQLRFYDGWAWEYEQVPPPSKVLLIQVSPPLSLI